MCSFVRWCSCISSSFHFGEENTISCGGDYFTTNYLPTEAYVSFLFHFCAIYHFRPPSSFIFRDFSLWEDRLPSSIQDPSSLTAPIILHCSAHEPSIMLYVVAHHFGSSAALAPWDSQDFPTVILSFNFGLQKCPFRILSPFVRFCVLRYTIQGMVPSLALGGCCRTKGWSISKPWAWAGWAARQVLQGWLLLGNTAAGSSMAGDKQSSSLPRHLY